ncbi:DUF2637 domain-containing protein [Streptomyces sp. HUAS ZL42]|uniref:DUF2637 domain-containing protein n=1 Tax=Streptomyces sp. HUAS ZL42 TaxID=3231715 RepID=UPI00345E6978
MRNDLAGWAVSLSGQRTLDRRVRQVPSAAGKGRMRRRLEEAAGLAVGRRAVGLEVWLRPLCALVVAGAAACDSYVHQREFALQGGADTVSALLWPLSVDGLLLLATRRARSAIWLAFLLGVAVSLAANPHLGRDRSQDRRPAGAGRPDRQRTTSGRRPAGPADPGGQGPHCYRTRPLPRRPRRQPAAVLLPQPRHPAPGGAPALPRWHQHPPPRPERPRHQDIYPTKEEPGTSGPGSTTKAR